jgi:hypothetical protein
MSEPLVKRSPWRDDWRILYSGILGFILQCYRTCFGTQRDPEDHD